MAEYKYFYRSINVKPTGFYFQNEALGGEVGYMYINPTNRNIVLKPVSLFNPTGGIAELVGLKVVDAQGLIFMDEPSISLNGIPHGAIRPGTIMMYVGKYEPPGWFFCNGKSISTSRYERLFKIIGYTYTNNTTIKNGGVLFTLPDFRYRTVKQLDTTTAVGGTTYGALNNRGGKHQHILLDSQIADHLHDGETSSHDAVHTHPFYGNDVQSRYGPASADPYGTSRTAVGGYNNATSGTSPFSLSSNPHTHPVSAADNLVYSNNMVSTSVNTPFSVIPPSFYISFIIRT